MKRISLFLIILIALFAFAQQSFAVLADVANKSVGIIEGDTYIVYYGSTTFSATDSTSNLTTRAMYVGDSNESYGTIRVWCTNGTGTEDVNGFLLYSNYTLDLTYFTGNTDAGLDQIQTTAKFDSVGCIKSGANDLFLNGARWMVFKMDGQSGNPGGLNDVNDACVVNWEIYLKKNVGAPKRGVAGTQPTT